MRRILYSSPYVPTEWIAAHGLEPHCLVPDGGRADTPVSSIAGVCPFMRAFVNEACAAPATAGIVLASACDQMRRAKDYVETFASVPVFLLNLPSTWKTPAARRLYRAELERLGTFLVEQGGAPPSPRRLHRALLDGERERAAQRRQMIGKRTGTPVALLGGPLVRRDRDLLDALADAGGHVVLDGTEYGERVHPAPFRRRRLRLDPLGELTSAYFGHIPDVFQRPNTGFYDWLRRKIPACGARGVILFRYLWCDKWHAEVRRLKDSLDVPLLDLDVDGTHVTARYRTRIQAFMEELK